MTAMMVDIVVVVMANMVVDMGYGFSVVFFVAELCRFGLTLIIYV